MKTNHVRKITVIAISSALAFLLQLLGSVLGLKVGGFLEIEISDLPALVTAFAYGPLSGVLVELFKNLIHCGFTSTGFVGEFANFIVNGIFVATAGLIYLRKRNRKGALISMVIATLAMSCAGILSNLFIMLPLYMKNVAFSDKLTLTLTLITPFNLGKGIAISLITFFIYKRLSPILKGTN